MTRTDLARAGLTVFAAFLASRILGWVRIAVLGNLFTLEELDPFFAAFRIPDLIYQLVAAGALGSALIPVLSGLLAEGQPGRAWRVASAVANVVLLVLAASAAVMFLFAPAIVPAMVGGFDAAATARAVELTRLMLLSPILLALGAVVSAILNAQNRFAASALAPVAYNASIIVVALLLAPALGIVAAALGVVVGSVLHLAIQLPALRGRFRWSPGVRTGDPAAHEALALMVPRAIGLGASQITFIVNTALASAVVLAGLAAGGAVAVYNIAFNVLQIPLGVIAVPVGMVLLPSLSRSRSTDDEAGFAAMAQGAVLLLVWISAVLSAVGIVLREQSIDVLFPTFDAAATSATAAALAVFLLGLPAHAMNVILARAFYAGKDTRTPVLVAIGSVVVNVVVSLLTVGPLGLGGLALGIALGGWFEALVLLVLLQRRVPAFRLRPMARAGSFVVGAALAAGIAAIVSTLVSGVLGGGPDAPATGLGAWVAAALQVVLAGSAAGVGYLLYSRAVRIPELSRALGLVRSAIRRG